MKKFVFTMFAVALLLFCALVNLELGMDQWGKAGFAGSLTAMTSELVVFMGDQVAAHRLARASESAIIQTYTVAIFIFFSAALYIAGVIGIFSGEAWVCAAVEIAVLCGLLIATRHVVADGFGVQDLAYLIANLLALAAVSGAKEKVPVLAATQS